MYIYVSEHIQTTNNWPRERKRNQVKARRCRHRVYVYVCIYILVHSVKSFTIYALLVALLHVVILLLLLLLFLLLQIGSTAFAVVLLLLESFAHFNCAVFFFICLLDVFLFWGGGGGSDSVCATQFIGCSYMCRLVQLEMTTIVTTPFIAFVLSFQFAIHTKFCPKTINKSNKCS